MARIIENIIQLQQDIKQLDGVISQSVVEYSAAWFKKQRALIAQRCLELINAELTQLSPDAEITESSELLMRLAQQIVIVVNYPNHAQVAVLGEFLSKSPGKLSLPKTVLGSIMVFLGLALFGLAIAFGITTFGLGIPLGILVVSIAVIGLGLGLSGGFVIHSGREKSLFSAIQSLLDHCITTNIEPAESVRLETTEAVSAVPPVVPPRPETTVATKSATPTEPSRSEHTAVTDPAAPAVPSRSDTGVIVKPAAPAVPPRSDTGVIVKPAAPAVPPRSDTGVIAKPAAPAVPPRSETDVIAKPAAPAVPPRSKTIVVTSLVFPVLPSSEPTESSKPAAVAADSKPLPAIPRTEPISSIVINSDSKLQMKEQATAPKIKKEGTSFQSLIQGIQETTKNVLSSKKEQVDNVVKNKKYVISIDDVAIAVLEGLGINYQIEKRYSEQQCIEFAERCVLEAKSYQKESPIYKQCYEIAFAFYDMALFKASEKAIQANKKTTENQQDIEIKNAKKLMDVASQAYRDKSEAYNMRRAKEIAKPKQSPSNELASRLKEAIKDRDTAKKIRDEKKKLLEKKSTAVDSIKSKTLSLFSKKNKKTEPIALSEQEVSNELHAYNLAQEDYQAKKLSVQELTISSQGVSPELALSKREYELAKRDYKKTKKSYEKLKPNEILEKFTDVTSLIIGSKKQGIKLEILNILKKMKECSQQFEYKAKKSYLNLLIDAFKKLKTQNEGVDELDLLAHVALYCLNKSHQDLATHIYRRLALAHYVSSNEALNKYLSKFEPSPIAAPIPSTTSIVVPSTTQPLPRNSSTPSEKPITSKALDKAEHARVNLLNSISSTDSIQKSGVLDPIIVSVPSVTEPAHFVVPPPPPPREQSPLNDEESIQTKTPEHQEKARVNLLNDIRKGVSTLKKVELNTQTFNQRSASDIEVIFLNALAKMQQAREDLNSSDDETETDTDFGNESEWNDDNYSLSSSSQDSSSGLSSSSSLRQSSTPVSGELKVGPRLFDGNRSTAFSTGSSELSRPDPKAVMALLKGKVPQSENCDNEEDQADDYLSL